jgi:GAF domain-containing protein
VRHGLDLTWARARLDSAVAVAGEAEGQAALTVAIRDGDDLVGRIECGPRRDGNPLLAEDRRLLGSLAGQAAAAARNLHLADELADRLAQIELQAAELTAAGSWRPRTRSGVGSSATCTTACSRRWWP